MPCLPLQPEDGELWSEGKNMEIIKTDVLVVGGGGAGLRAALAAREGGSKVCVAAKSPAGKSTCTYLAAGLFSVAIEGMSKEEHIEETLQTGKGINVEKLVRVLAEDAPDRVLELEKMGLVGERSKGRFNCLGKPPSLGAPLTHLLTEIGHRQGVSFLPWIMIFDLILDEGEVVGALGFEFRQGKWIAIQSQAVVLANGGGGALYRRHDNPVRITGDGYALAFRAGCRLQDMEFVQFMPTGLAEPGKPAILIAPYLADIGRVVNSAGEDILQKYQIHEKPVALRARDSLSFAIFVEEIAGKKVFLDLRSLSEEDWAKNNVVRNQRNILSKHFGCAEKPLAILPLCHHFMGGVVIDLNGSTDVPGLFAGGEVAGGVHGANRMGGNAFSEMLVFGFRAGRAASQWRQNQNRGQKAETLLKDRLEAAIGKYSKPTEGQPPRAMRKLIGEILWKKSGILRDKPGLEKALASLRKVQNENLPTLKKETPKEILEAMEVENALLVAEMISRSALFREESRGAHFRRDFVKTEDPKWKGNIYLKKGGGDMQIRFCPIG